MIYLYTVDFKHFNGGAPMESYMQIRIHCAWELKLLPSVITVIKNNKLGGINTWNVKAHRIYFHVLKIQQPQS